MPKFDTQTIQLTLVALVAAAMVVQAIVVLAALVALRKLAKSIREQFDEIRNAVLPVIDTTRELVECVKPRIEETTEDLVLLTRSLRAQTADIQAAADDIVARAHRQASRVDSMLSGVLDKVDRAGAFMADTVARPMRQLSALMASARAIVDALRADGATNGGGSRVSGRHDPYA